MLVVPLVAAASQSLRTVVGQQNCNIAVYQKSQGLFFDLSIESRQIVSGVLCRDRVRLVRAAYLGLVGDFAFMDTQGAADPSFEGLGSRWQLVYLEPGDL